MPEFSPAICGRNEASGCIEARQLAVGSVSEFYSSRAVRRGILDHVPRPRNSSIGKLSNPNPYRARHTARRGARAVRQSIDRVADHQSSAAATPAARDEMLQPRGIRLPGERPVAADHASARKIRGEIETGENSRASRNRLVREHRERGARGRAPPAPQASPGYGRV